MKNIKFRFDLNHLKSVAYKHHNVEPLINSNNTDLEERITVQKLKNISKKSNNEEIILTYVFYKTYDEYTKEIITGTGYITCPIDNGKGSVRGIFALTTSVTTLISAQLFDPTLHIDPTIDIYEKVYITDNSTGKIIKFIVHIKNSIVTFTSVKNK